MPPSLIAFLALSMDSIGGQKNTRSQGRKGLGRLEKSKATTTRQVQAGNNDRRPGVFLQVAQGFLGFNKSAHLEPTFEQALERLQDLRIVIHDNKRLRRFHHAAAPSSRSYQFLK